MLSHLAAHPTVEWIWNFWPYTMFIWNPFREILNIPLFPWRLAFWWVEDLWNFLPESLLFLAIQGFAVGYICDGKSCSLNQMVLNDTEGTFIVVGFVTVMLLSLHWAVVYLLIGSAEVIAYSAYYIDMDGIDKAGEL